jgi:phospholipid transport system substrate-binding protein
MASCAHGLHAEYPTLRDSCIHRCETCRDEVTENLVHNIPPKTPGEGNDILEVLMGQRSLLLSAFVLLAGLIGGAPRSSAAPNDPVSLVNDLGAGALVAMRDGETAAAREGRFRQLYRQYFDTEACARSALGPYWQNATARQRREFVARYEDYVVIGYATPLAHLGGESFTVLGSQPDKEGVLVTTRLNRIDGAAPIEFDWQLDWTGNGYKVTDVIVSGIDMATMQHSDVVSVIQRNSGHVQLLLVALRDKNASNGMLR